MTILILLNIFSLLYNRPNWGGGFNSIISIFFLIDQVDAAFNSELCARFQIMNVKEVVT